MPGVQKTVAYPAINRPAGLHKSFGRTRMSGNNTSQAYGRQLVAYALQPGGSLFSAVARAAARSGNEPAMPLTEAHSGGCFFTPVVTKMRLRIGKPSTIIRDNTPAKPMTTSVEQLKSCGFFISGGFK